MTASELNTHAFQPCYATSATDTDLVVHCQMTIII